MTATTTTQALELRTIALAPVCASVYCFLSSIYQPCGHSVYVPCCQRVRPRTESPVCAKNAVDAWCAGGPFEHPLYLAAFRNRDENAFYNCRKGLKNHPHGATLFFGTCDHSLCCVCANQHLQVEDACFVCNIPIGR